MLNLEKHIFVTQNSGKSEMYNSGRICLKKDHLNFTEYAPDYQDTVKSECLWKILLFFWKIKTKWVAYVK